jgi:cyclic beta-1,2-glucan synthetase
MAGDICSQPPYVGRGGWSWYTGAAAWMHRAAIESIFGLRQGARDLCFMPCLPSHWQQAELTLDAGQPCRCASGQRAPGRAAAGARPVAALDHAGA